jgi:hypothetical protein
MHCGILLDFLYELYYDAQIHKHHVQTKKPKCPCSVAFSIENYVLYNKSRS